jgi:hypothetical protein
VDPVDLHREALGERMSLEGASDEGSERGHAPRIPGISQGFSVKARVCRRGPKAGPLVGVVGPEKDAR